MLHWQSMISSWVKRTFGEESQQSKFERSARFIEEALELCQTQDLPKDYILQKVEEVYSRPKGNQHQETGGVFVTFLALCDNIGENAHSALYDEWKRINSNEAQERMQRRQAEKSKLDNNYNSAK